MGKARYITLWLITVYSLISIASSGTAARFFGRFAGRSGLRRHRGGAVSDAEVQLAQSASPRPFPQVPLMEFLEHAASDRHVSRLKKLVLKDSAARQLYERLIGGYEGDMAIIPLDVAWMLDPDFGAAIEADADLRRSFLTSCFVRRELQHTVELGAGGKATRLAALNGKYIYTAATASSGMGSLCRTHQSFQPFLPKMLTCAHVLGERTFSDIQVVFVDAFLKDFRTSQRIA